MEIIFEWRIFLDVAEFIITIRKIWSCLLKYSRYAACSQDFALSSLSTYKRSCRSRDSRACRNQCRMKRHPPLSCHILMVHPNRLHMNHAQDLVAHRRTARMANRNLYTIDISDATKFPNPHTRQRQASVRAASSQTKQIINNQRRCIRKQMP